MKYLLLFFLWALSAFPTVSILKVTPASKEMDIYLQQGTEKKTIRLPLFSSVETLVQKGYPTLSHRYPLSQVLHPGDCLRLDETKSELININQATLEQWMSIPGIGENLAKEILLYQQKHGLFQRMEDLLNVKGIGKKKYEKIKEYISL